MQDAQAFQSSLYADADTALNIGLVFWDHVNIMKKLFQYFFQQRSEKHQTVDDGLSI